MTKIVKAVCTLHWKGEPREEVPAVHVDAELSWAGQTRLLDLCELHKREVDEGKWPLPLLLELGDPAPPAAARRPSRAGQKHHHGRAQPTGVDAEMLRAWVREDQIMSRDDGPPRLAYTGRQGNGQYFPTWLQAAWDEVPADRKDRLRAAAEAAVAARETPGRPDAADPPAALPGRGGSSPRGRPGRRRIRCRPGGTDGVWWLQYLPGAAAGRAARREAERPLPVPCCRHASTPPRFCHLPVTVRALDWA